MKTLSCRCCNLIYKVKTDFERTVPTTAPGADMLWLSLEVDGVWGSLGLACCGLRVSVGVSALRGQEVCRWGSSHIYSVSPKPQTVRCGAGFLWLPAAETKLENRHLTTSWRGQLDERKPASVCFHFTWTLDKSNLIQFRCLETRPETSCESLSVVWPANRTSVSVKREKRGNRHQG